MAYSHASLERDKELERYEGKTRNLVSLSNWKNDTTDGLGLDLVDVSLSFAVDPSHSAKDIDEYFANTIVAEDGTTVIESNNDKLIKHDLIIKSNDDVIVQGVKFLLRTRRNESLFNPSFYCDLESFLFEFVNDISAQGMKRVIEDAIRNNLSDTVEFRAVDVQPRPDENGYLIKIFVSRIDQSETIEITDFLEIH